MDSKVGNGEMGVAATLGGVYVDFNLLWRGLFESESKERNIVFYQEI